MHVLRQVHRALTPEGLLLDIHPLGDDFAVMAGERGVGFVDTRKFREILAAMDNSVERVVAEGLFEVRRVLRRHVVERCDTVAEALEEADSWENLTPGPGPARVAGNRGRSDRVHRHRSVPALGDC